MAREIRLEGTDRLRRNLMRLDETMRGQVLAAVVLGAAEPVRALAASKAPSRSGALRETMTKELLKQTPNRAEAGVGPHKDAFYGLFQEYGTVHHAAQPFLRPAYDEKKQETVRVMRDDLRARVRGAVR